MILTKAEAQKGYDDLKRQQGKAVRAWVTTEIVIRIGRVDLSTFVRNEDPKDAPLCVLVYLYHVFAPYDRPKVWREVYPDMNAFITAYGLVE
jgi:hypothetical protein